jgi:U32 family peptidase
MNNKSIEILAPAGNRTSLHAAIQGGADAVYFGVGHLNMRSRGASNFDLSELPEIVSICSNLGVRSYLTLNTVMYNRDLPVVRIWCGRPGSVVCLQSLLPIML